MIWPPAASTAASYFCPRAPEYVFLMFKISRLADVRPTRPLAK
jgi:hypothetical protein